MAKRAGEPSQAEILASIRKITEKERVEEADFERQIAALFEAARWKVMRLPDGGRTRPGDLLVIRNDLGRERRYIIDVVSEINPPRLKRAFEDFRFSVDQKKEPDFDEYWLVGPYFIGEPMRKLPRNDRRFRALDLKQLRELLALPKSKRRKVTTHIGKAVLANAKEINLAIAGLMLQIDAKLEALHIERPNSDEGQARVRAEITDFERMKVELQRIREMVAAFKKGKAPEAELVKNTKTFRQVVETWWSDKGEEILTSTAKGAILVSSIGLLALMKADGVTAIGAVAAVVNGGAITKAKKIGNAIKRIGTRAFGKDDAAI